MPTHRRAFTMLELLVALGIIFLLATLLIVSVRGARSMANRTESLNALKQMALAYTAYSSDNRQSLMPGAISEEEFDAARDGVFRDMKVYVAKGTDPLDLDVESNRRDAGSYVWRLAPYMDFNWKNMVTDYRSQEMISRFAVEYTRGIYGEGTRNPAGNPSDLGIGYVPPFGMNSIFVGGDDVHGGPDVTSRNPWRPDDRDDVIDAATRLTEAKNPSRLIVFAPSANWAEEDPNAADGDRPVSNSPVTNVIFGSAEIRPPMLDWDADHLPIDLQWEFPPDETDPDRLNTIFRSPSADYDAGGGWPYARWGGQEVPTAHLDGSTLLQHRLDLAKDLRKWAPKATGF